MPIINVLPPLVADMIAAGEVVERPGNAVKELLENSIDAGAKNIIVEIRGGGSELIKITDDGCGMAPEDAGVAFLRHATSKLKDEHGLEAIATLGFRGEALAAISAVSRVEMYTRQKGAPSGVHMLLDAGDIQDMTETGCPEGTVIAVRDLFYNTPARRKFLKSDRAEGGSCVSLAMHCALGRPDRSIRCIKDGKEEFFSPGDGRLDSCVYSLLGRDIASNMLECGLESGGIEVRGFVCAPHAGRGNRSNQFYFVNGRSVRSATLQSAVEQAYKNTMLVGKFPSCVLYLTIGFGSVDVNVHPTKSEVRFSNEREVFNAVYYATLGALSKETGTAEVKLSAKTESLVKPASSTGTSSSSVRLDTESESASPAFSSPRSSSRMGGGGFGGIRTAKASPRPDFYKSMSAEEFRNRNTGGSSYTLRSAPAFVRDEQRPARPVKSPDIKETQEELRQESLIDTNTKTEAPALPETEPESSALSEARGGAGARVIGEALGTYILAEYDGALVLIDKHAAHERIIFDELCRNKGELLSQTLLEPIVYRCGGEALDRLVANHDLLENIGFEIEALSEDSAAIRAVPSGLEGQELSSVEEISEKLSVGGSPEDLRDEILHTVACKAAIKAGKSSEPQELETLAKRVCSGEIRYCPHGRPVAVTLTKYELDKNFKRIV